MLVTELGPVLVLVGLILAGHWLAAQEVIAEQSNAWPNVEGVIVRLRRRRFRLYPGGRLREYYAPIYEYCLEDRTYRSGRLSIGVPRHHMIDRLADIEEGGPVTVYYHPDNPELCLLFPGGSFIRKYCVDFSALLLLLIVAAMILAFAFWYLFGSIF